MLFHMSFAAREPRYVAEVIAELWGGEALPFPPVSDDGWIVFEGDEHGTAMEVYPLGTVLREAVGDADAVGEMHDGSSFSASHAAISTSLDLEAVLAIAEREGWPAKFRKRGGTFGVIEMWIEGHQMIEVLTPEMQDEYRAGISAEGWRRMLAQVATASSSVPTAHELSCADCR